MQTANIENYSYRNLRTLASELNIPNRSRYNKVELYNEILNYMQEEMLRHQGFNDGAGLSKFFKKIVGKCNMPPPPITTPSINFQQNTPTDNNRQIVNYCTNAIKDLQKLKPTPEQELAVNQFNDFVRTQNAQIQKQLSIESDTPSSRNNLISDIATLGNSCRNFYVPLRQQITKDKCY